MHPGERDPSGARTILALLIALVMVGPGLSSVLFPVAGFHIGTIKGEELPLEWTLDGNNTGTYDLTLPPEGRVLSADLVLEGAGVDAEDGISHGIDDWRGSDTVSMEGFVDHGEGLAVAMEHHDLWSGIDEMQNSGTPEDLEVNRTRGLILDRTSPAFSNSGGGYWPYYQEFEVALNSGAWEYDTSTYLGVHFPKGRVTDVKQIRIADPDLREVPYQVAELQTTTDGNWVTYVELIFPTDMPPEGPRPYRVYYGNHVATAPDYDPWLLGAEMFEYNSPTDTRFTARWKALPWSGGSGAGSGRISFIDIPGEGKMFHQEIDVSIRSSFSMVYTDEGQKYSDFKLLTWVADYQLGGDVRGDALWGVDFRVSGDQCYRLTYYENLGTALVPKLTLYKVPSDRHRVAPGTQNLWTVLGEFPVGQINMTETTPILILAKGDRIRVWVGDHGDPVFDVRDNTIAAGYMGTFLSGMSQMLSTVKTHVELSYGPMFVFSADINLTDKTHTFLPSGERSQRVPRGTYVSGTYQVKGYRDALFSIETLLPRGTGYTANLQTPDGTTLIADIRDGDGVPEGVLDEGFRLEVVLDSDEDHVTPQVMGWGVGYMARAFMGGDRTPSETNGIVVVGDTVQLAPSRDTWVKDGTPVLKPGNIPEDTAAVQVGSIVGYAGGYRLYYTGVSSSGAKAVCMAGSPDGREFFGHQVVLPSNQLNLRWDSNRLSPSVVRYNDIWLMYYVGQFRNVGQVGLAISSNGVDWNPMPQPILSPESGNFDGYSIEDCSVVFDTNRMQFYMYYTGKPASTSGRTSVGYAMSYDGATFLKSNDNPVLAPSTTSSEWDSGYVACPHPVVTRDKVFLYYLGGKGSDASNDPSSVGYASSDNGKDFKKAVSNPVMEPRRGGEADDYWGIRSVLVLEDAGARHLMLFCGDGTDRTKRLFRADSGYVREGHYMTEPFALDRAPATYKEMVAEFDETATSDVIFLARTSDDGNQWTGWHEMVPGEPAEGLPPGPMLQLRMNLSSERGEETPHIRYLALTYDAYVAEANLTFLQAHHFPWNLTFIVANVVGDDVDDVRTYYRKGMEEWEEVVYGGHARYGEGPDFDYRLEVETQPGVAPLVRHVDFTLGFISLPSNVQLDFGDDGSWEWRGTSVPWDGSVRVSIAEHISDLYNDSQDGYEVTIPVRIGSWTPGRVSLVEVSITVDTPPIIQQHHPLAEEVWMDEGATKEFMVTVEELDDQELTYEWEVGGETVDNPLGPLFKFTPDEGVEWSDPIEVFVSVSDGFFSDSQLWTVHVNETVFPVNKPPVLDNHDPTSVNVDIDEGDDIDFWVYAQDPDNGPSALTYRWYLDDELQTETTATFKVTTDSSWAGEYEVMVEISDGKATIDHTWNLRVKDVEDPGPPPDGDGDGQDDDGTNWLPLLVVLIIAIVAGAGGTLYMRGQRERAAGDGTAGPTGPDVGPPEEPVLAEGAAPEDVPTFEDALGKDVAAAPGAEDAAAAAGVAAPLVGLPIGDMEKDRTYVVEEVYVVYNDGRLMCHQARAERTSVDTDLFGGMFTAIQQFIQDSMGGGEGGSQVGRLDYGENRIIVERGKYIFLATIIYGEEQEGLRDAIRDVVNRIEGSYAGVIERWTGDQTQLAGVGDFVAPLIGLTQDLNREAIMARTRTEGVKMLSEVEFFQGFVRLKVAVRNDTKTVITNAAVDISYDSSVLRVSRIQPEYEMSGTKVKLGTISPREKKTVAYYLDPLICQESDIDGTTTFKDASGQFGAVTMKRRRADIVCPIFFTEENANTAMLKRLIHEELKESDSKIFTIPKMLPAEDAFGLGKEVVRSHDVRFVREYVDSKEGMPFHGEAWFYGVTKVKKDKMVIRTSIWEDRNTIEFFVASSRVQAITGLLAEMGQNLNKALKQKYLGRVEAKLVVDPDEQEEVKGLELLIDMDSESEMEAGEVDQMQMGR